jgi:hypothetical protein
VPVDCGTKVEPGSGDGGSVLLSVASVDGTCVLAVGKPFSPPKKSSEKDSEKDSDYLNARLRALVSLASSVGESLGELV